MQNHDLSFILTVFLLFVCLFWVDQKIDQKSSELWYFHKIRGRSYGIIVKMGVVFMDIREKGSVVITDVVVLGVVVIVLS